MELHAEGWSVALVAAMLSLAPAEVAARLRALCCALEIVPRADGCPPVNAARMWLLEEARAGGVQAA